MKIEDQVIIENSAIEIKENSTILFGLAGVGLKGPIIANTLIEQIKDMEQLGFITSEDLSPIAVFYDGVLRHPFRLFYSHKHNIIVAICEVPFQTASAYNGLSKVLCKWALSEMIKVKEIVIFQGIPKKGEIDEFPVYFALRETMLRFLKPLA
ncbi:MAG: PAC2 family protein [Candidatus Lokiarchaeota archaeon]|jgi:predicted ATP-grasp superfamily ATP-dependent carboligase